MLNKEGTTPPMDQHIRHVLDASAVSAAFLSFLGVLQPLLAVVATSLSICWLCVQFYDRHKRKLAERLSMAKD
jgi:hypothetical protein